MHDFKYKDEKLFCEGVSIEEIADSVGSPVYVYSYQTIIDHYTKLATALESLDHLICYSVKSNSNMAVCRSLINQGAGVDVVSGGEIFRAKRAGAPSTHIVYAGVGKSREEIEYALRTGILFFTVESEAELELINEVATSLNQKASVALRVNPDVDPKTHTYISTGKKENKFGLDIERAYNIYKRGQSELAAIKFVGIHMHIGSQITISEPFGEALDKIIPLIARIKELGIDLKYFDVGGGLGIIYDKEEPLNADTFAQLLIPKVKDLGLKIIIEPGRFIVGNAGILVTKVLYVKENAGKHFVIVDAGMNDLIRPSLYGAYHQIQSVNTQMREFVLTDVVGPICESGDFFVKDRKLPEFLSDELIAIMSCGAYGFTMSSNYNSRRKVAEVLVKGDQFFVIKERESYEDLIRGERYPEFLV